MPGICSIPSDFPVFMLHYIMDLLPAFDLVFC